MTERRLLALGVTTVGDLAALPPDALERYLGAATGRHLAELSRGIDDRPVVPEQAAKSIGHEETFAVDVWDRGDLDRRLHRMVDASATALRRAGRAARTVTVKLRFGDFTQVTRSHTLDGPVDAAPAIASVAGALLGGVDVGKGVRLLGVSLSGLSDPAGGTQLRLDLDGAGPGRGEGPEAGPIGVHGAGEGPVAGLGGGPRGRLGGGRRACRRCGARWPTPSTPSGTGTGARRWVRHRWSPRTGCACAPGGRPSGARRRPPEPDR